MRDNDIWIFKAANSTLSNDMGLTYYPQVGPAGKQQIKQKIDPATGHCQQFWSNGALYAIGMIVDGCKHGPWQHHFRDGHLSSAGCFDLGHKEGYWQTYNDLGFLAHAGEYRHGRKTGEWKDHYPDGRLRSVTTHQNGTLHGHARYYTAQSALAAEGDFHQGEKNGLWFEYPDDNAEIGRYRHGQRQGQWLINGQTRKYAARERLQPWMNAFPTLTDLAVGLNGLSGPFNGNAGDMLVPGSRKCEHIARHYTLS